MRTMFVWGLLLSLAASPLMAQQPDVPPPPPAEPGPANEAPAGPVSETIWPGIVRWYPSAQVKANAPPSLIVQIPPHKFQPGPTDPRVVPQFGEADGRRTAHIPIEPGTSLYGAGPVPGPLLLNGRTFVAAPADRGVEPPAEHAASLAVPWVVAVRPDGTAVGVMADTTWRTEIDLTDGIAMRTDGPVLPIIIVDADSPLAPPAALSQLAGWQEIPPRYALGMHLAATTVPDEQLAGLPERWRSHGLSPSVVWSMQVELEQVLQADAESQWQAARAITEAWKRLGVHAGVPVAAAVHDEELPLFKEGAEAGHWVRRADGEVIRGSRGGVMGLPDVSRQPTRDWLRGLLRRPFSGGFAAISILAPLPPEDGVLAADPDLGGPSTGAAGRAVFASLMARAARDAAKSAFPDQRPFVALHHPSLISQRYGYTFLPAPGAVEDFLPAILNASLSGQAMVGLELSAKNGESGGRTASDFAIASLLPLFLVDARLAESSGAAWILTPQDGQAWREALERRSRLMPYLYTVALDAYRFGYPMVRPVLFAEPANPELREIDDAFLLGEHLLVQRPGTEPLLPGWRRFDFGEKSEALPEMYIRPGAIIPVGPVMQHESEKPLDPLTLLVCLSDQGQALGVLYEDAGDGFSYTKNDARIGYYMASLQDGEVTVRLGRLDGAMGMARRKLIVRVLLPDGREASTEYWDALDAKVKLP